LRGAQPDWGVGVLHRRSDGLSVGIDVFVLSIGTTANASGESLVFHVALAVLIEQIVKVIEFSARVIGDGRQVGGNEVQQAGVWLIAKTDIVVSEKVLVLGERSGAESPLVSPNAAKAGTSSSCRSSSGTSLISPYLLFPLFDQIPKCVRVVKLHDDKRVFSRGFLGICI
jgi:hypothetical protein